MPVLVPMVMLLLLLLLLLLWRLLSLMPLPLRLRTRGMWWSVAAQNGQWGRWLAPSGRERWA